MDFFKGVFFLQQEIGRDGGGGVLFKQEVSEGLFINTKLEPCGHDKDKFGGDN